MYTDEEERRGLPIKTFLTSLILIIILVLLLVWLLPMPNMKPINDRIFNANIQEMKNAAIPYFTTEKLPQKVGDKVTLTLQEMLDLKLLLPFTDKNGDACDTKESYVTLVKKEDSYEMKVNLKCNEEEDYILVTLGCYSYCTSAICEPEKEPEKEPTTTNPTPNPKPPTPTPTPTPSVGGPSCVLYITDGTLGSNGWYTSNAVVKFKSKTTTVKNAKIVSYGLTTGNVSYNGKDSYIINQDGTSTVYGYVKDSTGKTATCSIVVKRDTVKPSCSVGVLSGNKGNDGSYVSDVVVGFTSKTDATSGVNAYGITTSATPTYNGQTKYNITTNGTHKVYGYVRDYAGNVSVCDISVKRNLQVMDSSPSCTLEIKSGTLGNNGWYLGNVDVSFKSKTTTNGAKITGYGIGFAETYAGNNTYTVTSDGVTNLKGYVKDSYGNTAVCSISVKKDAKKPSCSLKVTNGTINSEGYYTSNVTIGFNSKTDVTSGIANFGLGKKKTYAGNTSYLIDTTGKHTVYGYVKDNAGNEATCSITIEKRNLIEYQYKKDIATQYSNWTDWKTSTYNLNNPPQFGKYPLVEIVDLGKSQVVDYYQYSKGNPIYKNEIVKVGTVQQTYCKDYKYYRTTTSTTTTTYAVANGEGWTFAGTVTTTGWPTDTLAVKYELVGFDYDCTGCSRTPRKIWNRYTRKVYTASSTDTVTTSYITISCAETEKKTVEIFGLAKKLVGYEEVRTPVYKDIYQYKARTRTVIKDAYTDFKWSVYNDQNLLNQGYVMTGNTRVVK